jgi:hypothetical protein
MKLYRFTFYEDNQHKSRYIVAANITAAVRGYGVVYGDDLETLDVRCMGVAYVASLHPDGSGVSVA